MGVPYKEPKTPPLELLNDEYEPDTKDDMGHKHGEGATGHILQSELAITRLVGCELGQQALH